MGETHPHRPTSSRLGMRAVAGGGGGEIVEVQGGHIVRSTGRKDRHSKVCTAKGPRDRRVRLSAHTAIQFYDVQDRLGYDRPSKAVDWLIKKAKAAIDELAELPAWKPTATTTTVTTAAATNSNVAVQQQKLREEEENHQLNQIVHRQPTPVDDAMVASGSRKATALVGGSGRISEFQLQHLNDDDGKYNSGGSAFLPPTLDTDIADTIKSFFPMVGTAEVATTTSSLSSFHNYPPPPDLLSRTTSGASNHNHHHHHHHHHQQQDLRLSLQSFQDPSILLQQHHQQQQPPPHQQHVHEQVLFAGTTALGFDGGSSAWSEQQHQQEEQEHGRLQRMVAWNNAAADAGSIGHGSGFIFNSPATAAVPSPVMFGHGQFFSQRGPLQSSNTPSFRAWIDPSSIATAAVSVDHHHYLSPAAIHQASIGFAGSSSGNFSGFRIPARIQGAEEHDGVSDKPSSASSDSRH